MDDISILGLLGFILLCVVLIDNLLIDKEEDDL